VNFQDFQNYLIPIAILSFFVWRFLKFRKIKLELPDLIEKGAVVVDVRSQSEFLQGSRPGSVNIPLNEMSSRYKDLDKNKTVILCCASGARSGMAVGILKKNGFSRVVNAGSWMNTLT
jgi:phage shock protein E